MPFYSDVWKIIMIQLEIQDLINLSIISRKIRKLCVCDQVMNVLFERDFGMLIKLNETMYFFTDTGESVFDIITVFDYYAAYYINYMLIQKSKISALLLNFKQKRLKNKAFVICNTYNKKIKDKFLSKNGMNLIKKLDGDIIFDLECPYKYNKQFNIYKDNLLYSFNTTRNVGSISKNFCVPNYHPLHFSNVDSRYFYINFQLKSSEEISSEHKKFRHKDYHDCVFIISDDENIGVIIDKLKFTIKVKYIINSEIHFKLKGIKVY